MLAVLFLSGKGYCFTCSGNGQEGQGQNGRCQVEREMSVLGLEPRAGVGGRGCTEGELTLHHSL